MNNRFYLYLLLVLSFPVLLHGQHVLVESAHDTIIRSDPGKLVTLVFRITNSGEIPVRLVPGLVIPGKWNQVSNNNPFLLEPGQLHVELVSVIIPLRAAAGNYQLVFELTSDQGETFSVQNIIMVNQVTRLSLELSASDNYVKAGESITSQYIIRNQGNAPRIIEMELFDGRLEGPSVFSLQPDSARVLVVKTTTSEDITNTESRSIRIAARISGEESTVINNVHRVTVIPFRQPRFDPYHRLPVMGSLTYLKRQYGGEMISGIQGELSGTGRLDPDGRHRLDFRLRGPDRFNLSVLGQHAEYYATYANNWGRITIGDHNFSLTPLTEHTRYGRGVLGHFNSRRLEMGGFYNQPRYLPSLSEVVAGYINYLFSPDHRIGFNLLRKGVAGETDPVDLASITASHRLSDRTNIFAEASKGLHRDLNGAGFHAGIDTRNKWLLLSGHLIHAGKNFPGYYTNTTSWTANMTLRITTDLDVSFFGRADDRNASRDTLWGTSPYREDYRAGVSYRISRNASFRGFAGYMKSEDRAERKLFHYEQQYLRMDYFQKMGSMSFNLHGNVGLTQNRLLSDDGAARFLRLQGNLSYSPSRKLNIGAFGAFERGNRYSNVVQNTLYYGMDLTAWITRSTFFSFRFQNNYSIEEYYRDRSLMNMRFTQRLWGAHEISLLGQYALVQKTTDLSDLSFAVRYSMRMGVPIKRAEEERVTLTGRIDNMGAEKVSGIVLELGGNKVTTDVGGNFVFHHLRPGIYLLTIDMKSLNFREIADVRMPMSILVDKESDIHVTFGLTTAATIRGKIELSPDEGRETRTFFPGAEPAAYLGRIIVEASNEEETIRLLSDRQGRFGFTNIRPGNWTIRLYDSGLPPLYRFEQNLFNIELKPGEIIDLPVLLEKRERSIRFVEPPEMIRNR